MRAAHVLDMDALPLAAGDDAMQVRTWAIAFTIWRVPACANLLCPWLLLLHWQDDGAAAGLLLGFGGHDIVLAAPAPVLHAGLSPSCSWLWSDVVGVDQGRLHSMRLAAHEFSMGTPPWKVAAFTVSASGAADVAFNILAVVPNLQSFLSPSRPSNIDRGVSQLWLRVRWTLACDAITVAFGIYEDRPSSIPEEWLAHILQVDPAAAVSTTLWPPNQTVCTQRLFPQANTVTSAAATRVIICPVGNRITVSAATIHVILPYVMNAISCNSQVCTGLPSSEHEDYFDPTSRLANGLLRTTLALPPVLSSVGETGSVAELEAFLWTERWESTIRHGGCDVLRNCSGTGHRGAAGATYCCDACTRYHRNTLRKSVSDRQSTAGAVTAYAPAKRNMFSGPNANAARAITLTVPKNVPVANRGRFLADFQLQKAVAASAQGQTGDSSVRA
jgi:hypothetical protein